MFREDMISDGIENCVQYINNFDVERTNPFAYFTQIVYYAFLRRIQKEKDRWKLKKRFLKKVVLIKYFLLMVVDSILLTIIQSKKTFK